LTQKVFRGLDDLDNKETFQKSTFWHFAKNENQKVKFLKRRQKPKKQKTRTSQKKIFAKLIFDFCEGHSAEQPALAAAPNDPIRETT